MGTELEYAAAFRAAIHKEALEKAKRADPTVETVIDRHPAEDYIGKYWDYPGKWYTTTAIPEGYRSREALIDAIVRDTLAHHRAVVFQDERYTLSREDGTTRLIAAGKRYALTCHPYEPCLYITEESGAVTAVHNAFDPLVVLAAFRKGRTVTSITGMKYDARDFCKMVEYAAGMGNIGIDAAEKAFGNRRKKKESTENAVLALSADGGIVGDDPFYALIEQYPDCVIDYCIVAGDRDDCGPEAHRRALARACRALFADDGDGGGWRYDIRKARGKRIGTQTLFTAVYPKDRLNYRKAFLHPPHENSYTGKDFAKVNAALFPKGTDGLEAYEWTTDWSDYFDDGHEWWGALCLTVYDKSLDRFAVILASATD